MKSQEDIRLWASTASREERARMREALEEADRADPVEKFHRLLKEYSVALTNKYDPMRNGTPGEYSVHSQRAAEAANNLISFVESILR